ncbi:MAG: prephenate/arogenate dehydrogenase family protein [Erythrobacter sp.]|jgi:cyclohexadieny/prephenate dehydrogenase|uniref:prephenate/arogenate dehydrogenase family protein n=1 Tax=Qipengyuania citrea TaxID=225971 RepID=UPI001A4DAFFF|nr:prephenate/arogenate dehydrogenase family protein [Qipengyuania citrea]MBL4718473.1 prephenate/arogenate dehydrogenase family protein [Erythrobacter sp.]MCP2017600.1 cyclohexadieny/prephenate dehydrogenase [Qipengyuania citrea]MDE0902710.1 prephenate/arogenate dehydrogenase family protein [Erythrobacter sp.]
MTISRVAIIGLGLIGGSIGLAVREMLPGVATTGWDADAAVRRRAAERGLAGTICETAGDAVREAELVILCVPVGAMNAAAEAIAADLIPGTIVSDVGSSKRRVGEALARTLPEAVVIPAHPVAGTENSGPDAGFPELFRHRWCIVTPGDTAPPAAVDALTQFWEGLGATVEIMDPAHHDLVLAVTSHIPHLIAYTIVGTASDLEDVTRGEVIKYSAGGFRDFTRIAASNPTMWRDVFLSNRDAVLEVLGRFTEDLSLLQRAIRDGDGDTLFDLFERTRAIRRSIIEEGQDDARPDFGRTDH